MTTVTDQDGMRTYRYDEFNNRIRKEETGEDPITYSYNNMNQLIEEKQGSDVITYRYDMLGNLSETSENGVTTKVYEFDSTNKLTKVITTEAITEFGYDGNGNRIREKVSKGGAVTNRIDYVVDKESTYQNIIMAKDSISSGESCFTFGNEQVSVETDGNISYYRTDEQNSITQILSKTGAVQADIQYDEYGVIINPEDVNINGNIFAYTGHVYDESTGLTYAKARYYDARARRFISEDSYRGEMTIPSSSNLYAYALNNPVKYTDPSGNIVIADDIFYLILGTGAVLATTYNYINSPAGKKAINEGAVAIHKGMVFAGELTLNTAISFVNWLFGTNSSAKDTKISFADMEYMVKVFQSSGYAVSLDSNDIYNFQIAMSKAKGEVATPCPAPAQGAAKPKDVEAELPKNTTNAGKKGSKEWNAAKKKIKEGKGKGINVKTDSQKEAEILLKEARPSLEKKELYSNNGNSGYEIHPAEPNVGNNKPHIKWWDWSNGKANGANGHIFFD